MYLGPNTETTDFVAARLTRLNTGAIAVVGGVTLVTGLGCQLRVQHF